MLGIDRVKVQFWDVSGSVQYQSYWPVLAKVRLMERCTGLTARCTFGSSTDMG